MIPTDDIFQEKVMQDKLKRELDDARAHIRRLENLLASDFAVKAPAAVVEKEREKLENFRLAAEKIIRQLEG